MELCKNEKERAKVKGRILEGLGLKEVARKIVEN